MNHTSPAALSAASGASKPSQNQPAKIIIPLEIAGKVTGYNQTTLEVEREPSVFVHFDITNFNAFFPKFINAQASKDKVAPQHRLLMQLVTEEDRDKLTERVTNDHAAVTMIFGELADVVLPNVEKTQKKS